MPISRRRFARLTFVGALSAASLGGGAAVLNYLYPRKTEDGLPKTIVVPAGDVPLPGANPLLNDDYEFMLVNLADEAQIYGGTRITSGVLAVSTACPHIRGECPVRWRSDFTFNSPFSGERVTGWMLCPCHGSTFTRAGVRVFGPSPRSLDTLTIEKKDGRVVVHLTEITEGGVDAGVEPLPWP